MFYNHFIATLYLFWDWPIDIVPSVSCCFLLVFYFAEYPYQTESKRSEIFWRLFSAQKTTWEPRKCTREGPWGPQPP